MKGFFSESDLITKKPLPLIAECGKCGLYKTCISPKMKYTGKGFREVLIVAEVNGLQEDQVGRQFVGPSGKLLQDELYKIGVDMRRDCWLINSLACRPPHGGKITKSKWIDYCRPNVVNAIKELKPKVILLLGRRAVQSVIGYAWKESESDSVTRWVGQKIPCQKINTWICPTWHPAFFLHDSEDEEGAKKPKEVGLRFFRKHLKEAFELQDYPWSFNKPPNYNQLCKRILDPVDAARMIRNLQTNGKPLAFDYETTTLKPDGEHARIVSCAISDGHTTIGYPWHGEAIKATRELLWSGVPMIASNLMFEERWTKSEFGKGVKNWIWDTMQAAHIIDNRKGVSGIKFQAFVTLGTPDWDSHIKRYLESSNGGGNTPNRIKELDIDKLLEYNCKDALIEIEIAQIQMKKLGVNHARTI